MLNSIAERKVQLLSKQPYATIYRHTDNATIYRHTDNATIYRHTDNATIYRHIDNATIHRHTDNATIYRHTDNEKLLHEGIKITIQFKFSTFLNSIPDYLCAE